MRAHDIEHIIQVNECSNTGAAALWALSPVTGSLTAQPREREKERGERRLNYDRIEVFMCWVCLCHCDLLALVLFLCVYAFVHMYV